MHEIVRSKLHEIQALCQTLPVRRLELFGSAARGVDFDPEISDIDILVEFSVSGGGGIFDAFFELKDGLERIFDRKVDVLSGNIENPYLCRSVSACKELLYESQN